MYISKTLKHLIENPISNLEIEELTTKNNKLKSTIINFGCSCLALWIGLIIALLLLFFVLPMNLDRWTIFFSDTLVASTICIVAIYAIVILYWHTRTYTKERIGIIVDGKKYFYKNYLKETTVNNQNIPEQNKNAQDFLNNIYKQGRQPLNVEKSILEDMLKL